MTLYEEDDSLKETENIVFCYILEFYISEETGAKERDTVMLPSMERSKPLYKCDKCSFTTTTVEYLKEHKDEHRKKETPQNQAFFHSCISCEFETNEFHVLTKHIEEKHKPVESSEPEQHLPESPGCDMCDFVASQEVSLVSHREAHSLQVACDLCSFVSTSNEELSKHKHSDHKFECEKCGFTASISETLKAHNKEKHEEIHILRALQDLTKVVNTATRDIFQMKSDSILVNHQLMDLIKAEIIENITEKVISKFSRIEEKLDRLLQEKTSRDDVNAQEIHDTERDHAEEEAENEQHTERMSAKQSQPSHPLPSSRAPPRSTSGPQSRKRSKYLKKLKVLYIGDSVAHNANFSKVEKETNVRIRTMKTYSSVYTAKAKWPKRNMVDVTPAAVIDTREDDEYTHIVLNAPTVDITNLDTSKLTPTDNTEYFKQEVVVSCKNVFSVAHEALKKNHNLVKVIISEHSPRYDQLDVDPISLKPALAKFANTTFNNLWMESPWKSKIIVAAHNLQCDVKTRVERFTDERTNRYDGIHAYSQSGKAAFTRSLIGIFSQAITALHKGSDILENKDNHTDCTQTRHQNQNYSVPVQNMFDVLGN